MSNLIFETGSISKLNSFYKILPKMLKARITGELAVRAQITKDKIIKGMVLTPKTGNVYKRGNRTHIASSPGNPPAIDSSDLAQSIVFNVTGNRVVFEAGNAKVDYAQDIEEGSTDKNIKPRPFFKHVIEKDFGTPSATNSIASTLLGNTFRMFK